MAMNPFPPQAYTRETLVKAYQWLQAQSPQLKELASTPDLLISLYQKAQLQGREALERPTLQNFKNELRSLAGMMGEFETEGGAAASAPGATAPTAAQIQNAQAVIPVKPQSSQAYTAPVMPPPPAPPNMPPHLAPQHISSQIPPHHASQTVASPLLGGGPGAGATANPSPTAYQQPVQQMLQPQPQNEPPSTPPVPTNQVAVPPTHAMTVPGLNIPAVVSRPENSVELNEESLAQLRRIAEAMNLGSTEEALKLALSIGYGRLSELFPPKSSKR